MASNTSNRSGVRSIKPAYAKTSSYAEASKDRSVGKQTKRVVVQSTRLTFKSVAEKRIYLFEEGSKDMRDILGGKGAGLAEMTSLGLPIPPGFTITTRVCNAYHDAGAMPKGLMEEVRKMMGSIEGKMDKRFGDIQNPLLVSVRSGAKFSMPGMMDTVLNLGLNDHALQGLIKKSNNRRFAYDAYRRFIQMFSDVVLGIDKKLFDHEIEKLKKRRKIELDVEMNDTDLAALVEVFKGIVKRVTHRDFPQDPWQQLQLAIKAVFDSWDSERAIIYRRLHKIPHDLGTAVNIQSMVFGNMCSEGKKDSGTGVLFTRNPSTGKKCLYGEFLMDAQGEDVVAGIRTPLPIDKLKLVLPKVYQQLEKIALKIERHYKDMQDMEFTIETGRLFFLQTRSGKRTAAASVKIACDMVDEKFITKEEAIMRFEPSQIDQLLHKQLDPALLKKLKPVAKGLPASPGAAVGRIVFDARRAKIKADKGEKVILVRLETSPEDIEGMHCAEGILTARGGMTSHAAVVARGMGKSCVAGCSDIMVDEDRWCLKLKDGTKVKEGEWLSLDGSTGNVYVGQVAVVDPVLSKEFKTIMKWADAIRTMQVRANADTPYDAELARSFGAEGIGLTRTEHMFFEGERIKHVREMILARSKEEREKYLAKLLPYQQEDFVGIFKAMRGLPVLIRLLDPPLHEFLPRDEYAITKLSRSMGIPPQKLRDKIAFLAEVNPMLGHRGCRLAVTYPEIYEMQVRAIFLAARKVKKQGIVVLPEIEIPLVGGVRELRAMTTLVERVAGELGITKREIPYKIGSMIEIPRACLRAGLLAQHIDFFSFGTNDLTQTTFGFSRDDAGKFLPEYIERGILAADPFQTIDTRGVGELMKMAVGSARRVHKNIEIGICGEHGGDPASVEFCHQIGLDYVSCSPYRVPIARLAAAQAVLKAKGKRAKNSTV